MEKFAAISLGAIAVFIFVGTFFDLGRLPDFGGFSYVYKNTASYTASVLFKDTVTAASLRKTFAEAEKAANRSAASERKAEKVKILIVPGHDAEFSGTVFGGLKEVELNLDLGQKIYDLLKAEPLFDVYLTQTKSGYTSEFQNYFAENREEIMSFVTDRKLAMDSYVEAGKISRVVKVVHNSAPSEVAVKLFGINKWANENGVDIVIHVHFNDYPGRKRGQQGEYNGFSIYVPEAQYSNAKGSKSVAEFIYDRLAKLYPQSNLPIENEGIVEDQELIAIGSNNTLEGAGMLIEYGYIYESAFHEPALRDTALSDLALQTYLGVLDFFGEKPHARNASYISKHQTEYVPHVWTQDIERGADNDVDTMNLQAALVLDGVYPPAGETKNDCTISGFFGPCTERGVKAFQEKHSIVPVTGKVGEQTRAKLNELYGK